MEHGNSLILNIDTRRINKELKENKIVVITGFQGIDKNNDIETLGRGGSDTSAVAIASALHAKECYIYSDVEGVYTADPNKISSAKKLKQISYDEMIELSSNGAKVLHTKCVELAKDKNIAIHAKSTFNDNEGTIINSEIRKTNVKSLVKNDTKISLIGEGIADTDEILQKALKIIRQMNYSNYKLDISKNRISILFEESISDDILKKMHYEIIEQES